MSTRGSQKPQVLRIIDGVQPSQMTEAKLGLPESTYGARKLAFTQIYT